MLQLATGVVACHDRGYRAPSTRSANRKLFDGDAPVAAEEGTMAAAGLSPEAVARYHRDGFYFPVPVMSEVEAGALRAQLEAFEARSGQPLAGNYRHKVHLLFTWAWDLVHHAPILDVVESVLGPDILCWTTNSFIKEARDPGFVSWHQDSTYWGLSTPDVMTAWVAFSPSSIEAGAMKMIPGSHGEQVSHRDTFNKHNLLTRGQEIAVEVDQSKAVDIVLRPGEMSLHHVRIFHGSEPNRTDDRRIGLAIRYIPTHVRQIIGTDGAVLVRGVDRYRHFVAEPRPDADLSEQALAAHRAAAERQAQILYAGTRIGSFEQRAAEIRS
jgi:non-haem Fe2+, alpha-ketoglutarate-dependent halogenase